MWRLTRSSSSTATPISHGLRGRLTPHVLSQLFYQPFSELPLSCEQVDERVRQVRICIEVLRRYVSQNQLPSRLGQAPNTAFSASEAEYRRQTYQAVLLKLGTSF